MKILTVYFKVLGSSTQRFKYIIEDESKIKEIIENEMKVLFKTLLTNPKIHSIITI